MLSAFLPARLGSTAGAGLALRPAHPFGCRLASEVSGFFGVHSPKHMLSYKHLQEESLFLQHFFDCEI